MTYDYVLIDCPPNLGLLTVNGLVAATGVIIPVQTQYYALKGLNNLVKVINAIRLKLNRDLRILGLLPTFFDGRTNLARDMLEELKVVGDHHVFNSIVRTTVKLGEAPLVGRPITSYAGNSDAARTYRELAREVIERWRELISGQPLHAACRRTASFHPRSSACCRRTARSRTVGVRVVPVDHIEPNPEQPRLSFDQQALDELSASIREHGVLQPILVRPLGPGTYQIVAGERRWRASRQAGRRFHPGAHRGHRRRHGPRDRDHREPPARRSDAARRSRDVRPDGP